MANQTVYLLLITLPFLCNNVQPSVNALKGKDKVSILTQRFQRTLFEAENYQTICDMREVFFPSLEYRYWQADNIELINIEVCLNIQTLSPIYTCKNMEAPLKNVYQQCRVFQWADSYLINLIDIHQLYSFDLLTTGVLYGTIAHSYHDRYIKISLNLTCDEVLDSMEDTMIDQALVQFLSWSKQYARYYEKVKPSSWDEKDQGHVTRKYDYATVDLLLLDSESQLMYTLTLSCFVFCNIMAVYLLLKYGPLMHAKLSMVASHKGLRSSAIKGLSVTTVLITLSYIIAVPVIHHRSNFLTVPCDRLNDGFWCIPKNRYEYIHRKQVFSFAAKYIVAILAMLLYAFASIYIVKTATGAIIFKHRYLRWLEVYLVWSILMGIHIFMGLASLPLLIFTMLTPMYMVFYLSCWTIGLALVHLPFAAVFHVVHKVREHKENTVVFVLWIIESIFIYIVGAGTLITLLFLYYLFLAGGTSLTGVKGILFSLLPPVIISIVIFVLKWKMTTKRGRELPIKWGMNSDIAEPYKLSV